MALKWFRKNKDKKKKSAQVHDAQQADSGETDDPAIDDPGENAAESLELEDQERSALQDEVDIPENMAAEVVEEPVEEDLEELVDDASGNQKKVGYFKRLRSRLFKTRKSFSGGFDSIFTGKTKIDDAVLEELEELLITSDIGVQTTMNSLNEFRKQNRKTPVR